MQTEFIKVKPISFQGKQFISLQTLQDTRQSFNGHNIAYATLPASAYKAQYLSKVSFAKNTRLAENLKLARETMDYVKDLNLNSTTRMEMDGRLRGEDYEIYENAMSSAMFLNRKRKNLSIEDYVKYTKDSCPLMRFGNCSDQAILAATYLKDKKNYKNFAMIASCEVTDKKAFEDNPLKYAFNVTNHVFMVIGLAPEAKLNDPTTWGAEAVIVDSWGEICMPAMEGGIDQVKKLGLFHYKDKVEFMNYAPFIDPTKDKESDYNWENYQRKLNN